MRIKPFPATQCGFLLLEALIALLLFSLGILGLVGMQAVSARVTADAQYRAEASMHADKLISEMRSSGNPATVALDYAAGSEKLQAWIDEIQAPQTGLPGANDYPPTVTIDGAPSTVTVSIFWKMPGESKEHQFVTVATIN